MSGPFRSLDKWREDLLTLPDSAWFELLRGIFGNIKTPYNKHRLMEDLGSFLSRPEVQETISLFIDGTDHKIIAAVAALENPAPGELESFFSGEFSCAELQSAMVNLEERFVLYRFRDEGAYRLALNPLLEPVLAPFAADSSPLFPSARTEGPGDTGGAGRAPEESPAPGPGGAETSPVDDRIIAALIAFVASHDEYFRTEGLPRKKVADGVRQLFPGLNPERLVGGLQGTGLIEAVESRLVPVPRRLEAFGALGPGERLEYLAAGIWLGAEEKEGELPWLRRGRIQSLARFIHRFFARLEPGRAYPRQTLFRIAWIAGRGAETPSWEEAGAAPLALDTARITRLLESMIDTGLLLPAREGAYTAPRIAGGKSRGAGKKASPVISMDTPFSCILYPHISWDDAIILASFCVPGETGAVVRFEMTRESVVRGFDQGRKAEEILGHLERLSGFPPDQNLRWTVTDWGERYSAVSLYQGTVLTLSEERRFLAETGPLAIFVRRTLAPGVYLLAPEALENARETLEKSGVDIIAHPDTRDSGGQSSRGAWPSLRNSGEKPAPADLSGNPAAAAGRAPEGFPGNPWKGADRPALAAERMARFHKALEGRFTAPVRKELAARIDRRLVVSESQLQESIAIKQERLEARNLDYPGKTLVAKEALARKSLLEIALPGPGGTLRHIFGIPSALEKSAGDSVLVLRFASQSVDSISALQFSGAEKDAEETRIPLGKISLIRRIKQSLFEK